MSYSTEVSTMLSAASYPSVFHTAFRIKLGLLTCALTRHTPKFRPHAQLAFLQGALSSHIFLGLAHTLSANWEGITIVREASYPSLDHGPDRYCGESSILSFHFILTHSIRSWLHRLMKSLMYLDFFKTEIFCASDDTIKKAKDNLENKTKYMQRNIQMANKVHEKTLNIVSHQRKAKKNHNKSTTSYTKMALIKTTVLTRMGRNWNPHTLLVEMQNNGVIL